MMRWFRRPTPVAEVQPSDIPLATDFARGVFTGVGSARLEIIAWLESLDSATVDCRQLIAAIQSHDPARLKE